MKTRELKSYGKVLGREGLAKRALEIAAIAHQQGNYKLAIECCGRMAVIAEACKFDGYWESKVVSGVIEETDMLERLSSLTLQTEEDKEGV